MLFHLIKKDFLIVKKYVLIVLVASILIPPVMRWRTPEFAGTFGFILSVIFSVFMLLQYVSLKEYQFLMFSLGTEFPMTSLIPACASILSDKIKEAVVSTR